MSKEFGNENTIAPHGMTRQIEELRAAHAQTAALLERERWDHAQTTAELVRLRGLLERLDRANQLASPDAPPA